MSTINIAYSVDDKFVLPLLCSLQSVISNNLKENLLNFYILYDPVTLNLKNINQIYKFIKKYNVSISFLKVDSSLLDNCKIKDQSKLWTKAIFYRLQLASLLKNENRVLYLDCDTVVLSNLTELYNMDLNEYYIAAVRDNWWEKCSKALNLKDYFNSGVMLIDLQKIRKNNKENDLFEYAKERDRELDFPDQDILNVIFKDKVKFIDKRWNWQQDTLDFIDCKKLDIKIFHFSGILKPWKVDYDYPNKMYFFNYFRLLPLHIKFWYLYYPNKYKYLKNIRKNIIWYSKTEKEITIFNVYKIKLNV